MPHDVGYNFLSHILTVLTWHWPIKLTWYLLGSGKVEVVAHFVLQILCLALYNCKKKCSSDWSNHSYNADFLLSCALQSESALSCTILIARQAISCALPNIVLLTTKLAGLTGLVWKQRMTSSRPSHLTTPPSPFFVKRKLLNNHALIRIVIFQPNSLLQTPGDAKAKAMPGRLYIHTKIT